MDSVKRTSRQKKTVYHADAILALTPALILDARALVSYYDHIDWEQVNSCDTVQLCFQSAVAVEDADRILLEMADGEPQIRNYIIQKIKKAFQSRGFPLDPGKAGEIGSSYRSVKKILANLTAASTPSRFAEQCNQAAVLHCKISSDVWRQHQHLVKTGQKPLPRPMAPPMADGNTSWFGLTDDRVICVPIHLAFAQSVIGLCRRISEINTGEISLRLEPGEADSLRLHRRLWTDCPPLSYRVNGGDEADTFAPDMQPILDDFVPVLRRFICDDIAQITATKLAAVVKDSTGPAITQVKTNESILRDAQEICPDQEKVNMAASTNPGERLSTRNIDTGFVRIGINKDMSVTVNGEAIRNAAPANALLALVASCKNGNETVVNIDTGDFVRLSHRHGLPASKPWNKNKNCLIKYGVKVTRSHNGAWRLGGFNIIFDPAVNSQQVRAFLQAKPGRVRKKASNI